EFGGDLASRLAVRALDRLHVRAEDRPAVLPAPLVRVGDGRERSLKARHHVAREQLVAPERLLARGPFVRTEQDAAEATPAQMDQTLDALDDGLGRADERCPLLHALAQWILMSSGWASESVLEVRDRLVALARVHLTERQLVVLRHVDVHHQ